MVSVGPDDAPKPISAGVRDSAVAFQRDFGDLSVARQDLKQLGEVAIGDVAARPVQHVRWRRLIFIVLP